MLLLELFDHAYPSLKKVLRNAILDVLMPLSSHGAKEVAIDTIVDKLKNLDLGIEVTADIIRDCVDPNKIPIVTDIDDQNIYMNDGSSKKDDEQMMDGPPQEPVDPVKDSAKKKASAELDPGNKPKFNLPV